MKSFVCYFYSGTTSPEREGENYRKQKKDDDENLKPKLSKYQERRRKAQMQFNKYAGKDELEDLTPAKGEVFRLRSCNVLHCNGLKILLNRTLSRDH